MGGSGSNRLIISSYNFGSSFQGNRNKMPLRKGSGAVIPVLATLGVASVVAAISLAPGTGNIAPVRLQAASERYPEHREGLLDDRRITPPEAVTARPQLALNLATDVGSRSEELELARRDESLRPLMSRHTKKPLVPPSMSEDAGLTQGPVAVLEVSYPVQSAPIFSVEPRSDALGCVVECARTVLPAGAQSGEDGLYSPTQTPVEVAGIVQGSSQGGGATTSSDGELLEQAAVLEAPSGYSDAVTTAERIEEQEQYEIVLETNVPPDSARIIESSETGGQRPEGNNVSAAVSTPVLDTQAVEMKAASTARGTEIREHLTRNEQRYTETAVASTAVAEAAPENLQLERDVEEISVFATIGGKALGSSSVVIAEDQLVSVRLGDLISLFQDSLERPLFVWMRTSSAASRYVTPETLAAAGLEVHFDPKRRQMVLGVNEPTARGLRP